MADIDVLASGAGQPINEGQVPRTIADRRADGEDGEREDAEHTKLSEPAAPSIPEPEDKNVGLSSDKPEASAAAAEATPEDASSKGKEKEQSPVPVDAAMEKENGEDDSLRIHPSDSATGSAADAHVCNITLLLPTGARHPYRIDEKYLTKRNVEIPETNEAGLKDPFSISIYKLKELILREWRDEWDGKPASPSSIRLIHFGKLLDDKEQLKSR